MERWVQFPTDNSLIGVLRFLIYTTVKRALRILQPDVDTKEATNHFQSANDFVDGMSKGMICAMVPAKVPIQ